MLTQIVESKGFVITFMSYCSEFLNFLEIPFNEHLDAIDSTLAERVT